MARKVRVVILEDHQSIVDGYRYRLARTPEIEVVATASYSSDLERVLTEHEADVVLMDVNVPTSPENANPYPILHLIPRLLKNYPSLSILVISMYAEESLVKTVMATGASGYILKEDNASVQDLGRVILIVAGGGIYFSRQILNPLMENKPSGLLTERQLEILSLLAAYPDTTSSAIALKLNISDSTVRNLLSDAYTRLNVHNRTSAILKARQMGLLTPLDSPLQFSDPESDDTTAES